MRLLVTGASGNIGRAVVADALGRGHEVWAVDRRPPAGGPAAEPITRREIDLRDADAVARLIKAARPDAVIHLAAIPHPDRDPSWEVFATNTQSTFAVLEGAGLAGVGRVAIASSVSLLGMSFAPQPLSPIYAPVDEDHPNIGSDPYALSKEVDEATARTMHRRHGFQVVALRIVNSAPMAQQIARATAAQGDACKISGELWSYLDVRDAARAFLLAVETDLPGCHTINVAAADTYSDLPTAELMLRCHPTTRLDRPLVGRESPMDLSRVAKLLGFSARFLIPRPLPPATEGG